MAKTIVARFRWSPMVVTSGMDPMVQSQHRSLGLVRSQKFFATKNDLKNSFQFFKVIGIFHKAEKILAYHVSCLTGADSWAAGLSKVVKTGKVKPITTFSLMSINVAPIKISASVRSKKGFHLKQVSLKKGTLLNGIFQLHRKLEMLFHTKGALLWSYCCWYSPEQTSFLLRHQHFAHKASRRRSIIPRQWCLVLCSTWQDLPGWRAPDTGKVDEECSQCEQLSVLKTTKHCIMTWHLMKKQLTYLENVKRCKKENGT